jgi:hypothetical protein
MIIVEVVDWEVNMSMPMAEAQKHVAPIQGANVRSKRYLCRKTAIGKQGSNMQLHAVDGRRIEQEDQQ